MRSASSYELEVLQYIAGNFREVKFCSAVLPERIFLRTKFRLAN